MHVGRYGRDGSTIASRPLCGLHLRLGDNMGIWDFIKNWVLDAKVSKNDIEKAFANALDLTDVDQDGFISVRDFINIFKKLLK